MTSAGLTRRSAARAGSAILAIAVSRDAMAIAAKIAATAHRRRSAGRPSMAEGPFDKEAGFDEVASADIVRGPDNPVSRTATLSAMYYGFGLNCRCRSA